MVMTILEPIAAGLIVTLLNKYIVSGLCFDWARQYCEEEEEITTESDDDDEYPHWSRETSSTTTTVSDATMHVHMHTH